MQLVLDARAILAEGPSWDSGTAKLYWVDILANRFCRWDPLTGANEQFQVGETVGAVVPANNEEAMIVTATGFKRYRLSTGEITPVVDPEAHLAGNRFNDGKCDALGRFWAGTMDGEEKSIAGALYCLDRDHTCRKLYEGVGISNGMDWSPDRKTMYYIDSMSQQVMCFTFDLSGGAISDPRVLIDFKDEQGLPDGMTVDEEGKLWIAHWDGWQVSRWDPHSGKKIATIAVPAARVTSCAFGGEKYDTLYITTATVGLSDEQLLHQPHAGGIFAIKPGVCGMPSVPYRK
ncbi:MAG: SMP-30/gluconolactonase/LRE family protein [Paenibacillaceae bacterium]|nr:SMP-30/gluconolactonase/LRE family protein [Paenibacillaceae bacterium]